MNPQQKLVTLVFIAAIAWTSYFAPWEKAMGTGAETYVLSYVKAPLWELPSVQPLERVQSEIRCPASGVEWSRSFVFFDI